MEGAPQGHAPESQHSCRSNMAPTTTRRNNNIPEKDDSEPKWLALSSWTVSHSVQSSFSRKVDNSMSVSLDLQLWNCKSVALWTLFEAWIHPDTSTYGYELKEEDEYMPVVKKAVDALVACQGIGFIVDKLPICKIFYGNHINIPSNQRDSKISAIMVPGNRIQKIRRIRKEVLYRNSRRAVQKHQK